MARLRSLNPKLERSSSTQGKKAKLQRTSTLELGRITGKVAPSSTTLSRAGGPFSGKKFVTFLYENALSKVSGGTNVVTVQVKPNDMYDYDNTGEAGNKQPLYYDALFPVPINNTRQFHGRPGIS